MGVTTPNRVRVLLADDHPLVRSGIRATLLREGNIDVVGEATNGAEVQTLARELYPDLRLLDLSMPGPSPLETIAAVRALSPDTRILVLTAYDDDAYVRSIIKVGVDGYLLKDAFPTDIAATVRDLVAGHSPISASIARFIVRRTQNTPEPPPGPGLNTAKLTPREIDILWGIAKGFSYAEIASHLSLSRQTVPGHIKNIYRKLEVHTRGEAVFEAVQQGLIKL